MQAFFNAMHINKIVAFASLAAVLSRSAAAQTTERPNIAKVNILGLTVGTVSLQYERALSGKFSIAAGMNVRPSSGLPMRSTVRSFIDAPDSVSNAVVDNSRISHFALTPEARYYFGKRPMTGFYTSLYARYASTSYAAAYTHTMDGKAYPVSASARGNSIGMGLLLGAQFPISDRIVIDWWIAGASINRTTFNVKGRADLAEVSAEDRAAVEDALEGDDIFNGAFDVSMNEYGGNARGVLTTPGFRTGLCVGVRF